MMQGKRSIWQCVASRLAVLFALGILHGCSSGGSADQPVSAAGKQALDERALAAVDVSALEGQWRGLSYENRLFRSDLVLRKSERGGGLEGEVQYGMLDSGTGAYKPAGSYKVFAHFDPETRVLDVRPRWDGKGTLPPARPGAWVYSVQHDAMTSLVEPMRAAIDFRCPYIVWMRPKVADQRMMGPAKPIAALEASRKPLSGGGNAPSNDQIRQWAAPVKREFPQTRMTVGNDLIRVSRILFQDDYFKKYFGKTFDQMTPGDRNAVSSKMLAAFGRGGIFRASEADNKFSREYSGFAYLFNEAAGDTLVSTLAQRVVLAWNAEREYRMNNLPADDKALRRIATLEAAGKQHMAMLLWPSESNKIQQSADASRKRIESLLDADPKRRQEKVLASAAKLESAGDVATAVDALTEALSRDEGNVELLMKRGMLYVRQQQPQQATADFSAVLKKDAARGDALQGRAMAMAQQGNGSQAIADYTELIRLEPKNSAAYAGRAAAYVSTNEIGKSLADCAQAIQLDAGNGEAYATRAAIELKRGDIEKAARSFDQAVRRSGVHVAAATDAYEQIIKSNPNLAAAYQGRATTHYRAGRYDRALSDLDKAIQLGSADAQVYTDRGLCLLQKDQYRQAMSAFDKALGIEPAATAYLGKAQAAYALNDYRTAIDEFTQAIKRDPDSLAAHKGRAMAYLKLTDRAGYLDAKKDLERAEYLTKWRDPQVYFLLALYHIRDSKYPGIDPQMKKMALSNAVSACKEAVKLDPQEKQYRQTLAQVEKDYASDGRITHEQILEAILTTAFVIDLLSASSGGGAAVTSSGSSRVSCSGCRGSGTMSVYRYPRGPWDHGGYETRICTAGCGGRGYY